MRKFLVLIILFHFCLCHAQESNINQIKSIFSETKKIEIYAYLVQSKWYKNDKYEYLKKDSIVNIPEIYLRNKIELSKKQISKLKKSIIKSPDKIDERADCYMPRHTIVFYDEKDVILGYVELCFSCMNSRASDNFIVLNNKMLFQEKLFKEFGIKYFEETDEETEEYYKNQEKEMMELEERYRNKKKKTDE